MITETRAGSVEIHMSMQEALQTIERLTAAVNRTLSLKINSTVSQPVILREGQRDYPSMLFMFVS